MRNPTEVLKSLTEKSKDESYRFQRLYRNLYNPEFYWLAYKNIYANKGSMTAGADGTTLPCGSYPFVNLREANTLLRKLFTSRKSEKNVRQHSGTQKGAIEAITSIHTGYMIRAPTFRRSTQRQEPHPLQLNTAAPQNLRSAGTAADAAERIYLWHFSIAQ